MAESPQIPDELRNRLLRRRRRVGIVRVTFAISIALMVVAFFYANESSTLTPAARSVSIIPAEDSIWLMDVQRAIKNAQGDATSKFQLHHIEGDEITHGPLMTASPEVAMLLPNERMGVVSGSRLILIDLSKKDWPLVGNIQLSKDGGTGVYRIVVVGSQVYVVWNENFVEDGKGRSRLQVALLRNKNLELETSITTVKGHIDSMGCINRDGRIWVVYHLRHTSTLRLIEFEPEFTETSGRAAMRLKTHISDDVGYAAYTTTGNDKSPFVIGMRKLGDESRVWKLSVFDGKDWHKADAPVRETPPSSLDVSDFMGMAWHENQIWTVYTDGKLVKLAKGQLGDDSGITWGDGKTLELDESGDTVELMTVLGVLVGLAMLTFLQAVWLMLNRSSGLERVLEDAIDGSDTELKDALGVKKVERKPVYASPLARGSALFIDLAMTAPIVLMLRTVIGFKLEHAYSFLNVGSAMLNDESLIVILRATLVTLLVLTIYSSICEFYWGKTLGKALLRLRIESTDGEPPAPWQILVRNIVKILELAHYILILIPLAFMMMSTKQQRLGDYLGRTVVMLDVVPEEQADDLDV